jgi:uncharacterized protein YeeX (DUF496 family)
MDNIVRNAEVQALGHNETKIMFKMVKEQRATRTYIFNLDKHLDEKKLEILIKNLKQSLGTSCIKKTVDGALGFGFNGDLEKRLYDYLINNNILSKDAFKK